MKVGDLVIKKRDPSYIYLTDAPRSGIIIEQNCLGGTYFYSKVLWADNYGIFWTNEDALKVISKS